MAVLKYEQRLAYGSPLARPYIESIKAPIINHRSEMFTPARRPCWVAAQERWKSAS